MKKMLFLAAAAGVLSFIGCGGGDSKDEVSYSVAPEDGPRFTAMSEECVRDNKTTLIWARAASVQRSWQDAVDFCNDATNGGYSDWRLPSKEDLETLLAVPHDELVFVPNHQQATVYWSSTEYWDPEGFYVPGSSAWSVSLPSIGDDVRFYNKSLDNAAWPVRGTNSYYGLAAR